MPGHISEWTDWRTAFIFVAALNVLGALLVLWLLPPSRHFKPHANVRAAVGALRNHLRNRALLAACGVGFCVLLAMVAAFTYINVVLAQAPFSFSPGQIANVFTLYLIGVVITPLAGRLIQRVGYRRALMIAVATGVCGATLTLAPSMPVLLVGLALASSGTWFAQSAALSFIAAHVRESRSLASGLYNFAYYLGGATGAWAGGLAFVFAGWGGTVTLVICAQLAAIALAWNAWRVAPIAPATSDEVASAVSEPGA